MTIPVCFPLSAGAIVESSGTTLMTDREKTISISQFSAGEFSNKLDHLAIEEPMEIRLVSGPKDKRRGKSLSITMRTPGSDEELALGFLFTEGIVSRTQQILNVEFCGPVAVGQAAPNTIRVELSYDCPFETQSLQRHFYTTSSCGVCGKASLDALKQQDLDVVESQLRVDGGLISELPNRLLKQQDSFQKTGGIHAAGLFDPLGNLLMLREDVGRHNALDKLIGSQFQAGHLPCNNSILVVSGRASFELLQKALTAKIPIFVAVGAPSSLAVELAREFKITLIGFASRNRFNVYSMDERIVAQE